MKRLHVIYVPGLGDKRNAGQGLAVRIWRLWGVSSELCQMRWAEGEDWAPKLERLLARIDAATAKGLPVALVGASAGASAVINAFAARRSHVVGCVLIAGKVNHPETIGERYRRENPTFVQSAFACQAALASLTSTDRQRILSRYALFDEIIARRDSQLAGGRNRMVLGVGHAPTIGLQITCAVPLWLHFLRHLASR